MKTFVFVIACMLISSAVVPARSKDFRPSDKYWVRRGHRPKVKYSPLPHNRRLATVGDKLYALDAQGHIIWTWSADGPPLTDQPVVDSKEIVYVIGYDLLRVALDSLTGKEIWRGTAVGRGLYKQIMLYQRDKYIVVTNMSGYRENFPDQDVPDLLEMCMGNDILLRTEIRPGAIVKVRGDKVFAIYRYKKGRKVVEIKMTRNTSEPIGKVSAIASTKYQNKT